MGKEMTFDEATSKIEDWETSGISKLLDKSKVLEVILYLQNVKNSSDSNKKLIEFLILCFGV
ncbi:MULTISPECIES: hypothetical protein [Clostridium]|uniref:hypothetical protein n=1 Tax=Clostridium TaxID=1485 RepID=UPI00163AD839|nr:MULTISPECIES: hypothetical protein [Clostridium]NOW33593.1 hypothetical protein [Clostridium beijerinckii]NOW83262.1 hypothetical protein [Clostridium beijerinckii]